MKFGNIKTHSGGELKNILTTGELKALSSLCRITRDLLAVKKEVCEFIFIYFFYILSLLFFLVR